MIRVFFFLFGFGFTTIGFSFVILYLNVLTVGYNFYDYVNFIIRRFECINIIVGIFLIALSIKLGGKNELYL